MRQNQVKLLTDKEILKHLMSSFSMANFMENLGIKDHVKNRQQVKNRANSFGVAAQKKVSELSQYRRGGGIGAGTKRSPIWTSMDDEEFRKFFASRKNMAECLKHFNTTFYGGKYRMIRERINLLKIDLSHFNDRGYDRKGSTPLKEIIYDNKHPNFNTNNLKTKLYRSGLKSKKCEECQIEVWRGKPISFHLHHIDGNNKNHHITNLQILCPMCHSQTPTYGGKNVRLKRLQDKKSDDTS